MFPPPGRGGVFLQFEDKWIKCCIILMTSMLKYFYRQFFPSASPKCGSVEMLNWCYICLMMEKTRPLGGWQRLTLHRVDAIAITLFQTH